MQCIGLPEREHLHLRDYTQAPKFIVRIDALNQVRDLSFVRLWQESLVANGERQCQQF